MLMFTDEKFFEKPIKGVLVCHRQVLKHKNPADNEAAAKAFKKLQDSGIPYRIITNNTIHTTKCTVKYLNSIGFNVSDEHVISPISIMHKIIKNNNLKPFPLVHNKILGEFLTIPPYNCLIIGARRARFTQSKLDDTFKLLKQMSNPKIYMLTKGHYTRRRHGLKHKMFRYIRKMELKTGSKAIVVGKPMKNFFHSAVADMGLQPEDVVVIGKHLKLDIRAAEASGLRGMLIKKTPFIDFDSSIKTSDVIVDDLEEAVSLILKRSKRE